MGIIRSMRYFVSDLHFYHTAIIKICNRPYTSVEAMNNDIIARWNKQVKRGDVVYVVGDFSFGNYTQTKAIVEQLHGQKVLIRGNHDERFDSRTFINMGFHDIYNYRTIKLGDGIKVLLNHYSYRHPWWKTLWNTLRGKVFKRAYHQFLLKDCGMPLVHGHDHKGVLFKDGNVNVAWDINGRLISETEIKEYLSARRFT